MAETVRELVVKMSMDAGGFNKVASDIKKQVNLVNSEIRSMGTESDTSANKVKLLGEKLDLQKKAVDNYAAAVKQAKENLANASTEADKLAKAKQLSALETGLANAQAAAEKTKKELQAINALKFTEFGNTLKTVGRHVKNLGRSITTYISAPLAALGIGSYNAFKDFESAFAGVRKTVNATEDEFDTLEQGLLDMSETMPTSAAELAAIMEVAGQLGVPTTNLLEFTKTMAMLGESTNIDSSGGAAELARFMNITKTGYGDVEKLGSVLVDLGNNFATSESEILAMSIRMASAGTLTGFTATDIMGLAAAMSSMGIEAEAGGSAASKLMKKMQLASEVGQQAITAFANGEMTAGMTIRDIQLAADDTKWKAALASSMEMTKEEVGNLIDSAVKLQQFSEIMGVSADQFTAGFDKDAAQSMINFFSGLANSDMSGNESVVQLLSEMGITEVRLSNMVATGAANAELYANTTEMAAQAYDDGSALVTEANKRYATTASQDSMLYNKIQNNMADAGENIADAIDPIKDKINDLMEAFGELSEVDQDRLIGLAGALIVLGPAIATLGKTFEIFGSTSKGIGALIKNKDKIIEALAGIAHSPIFLTVAAGAAIYALASFLSSIPTGLENTLNALANIQINIDETSKNETLAAIAQVKKEMDSLTGAKAQEYAGTSAAVAAGYGTSAMFGQALEYERQKAEASISDISGTFTSQIDSLNKQIGEAVKAGDTALADALAGQRDAAQAEWDSTVQMARGQYTDAVTALINGMMLAQPEAKAAMEKASQEYDVLAMMQQALASDADTMGQAAWDALKANIIQGLSDLGYGDMYDLNGPFSTLLLSASESLAESLKNNMAFANQGTLAYTLISSLLSADGVMDMIDVTQIQGAFDGIVESLDFKQSVQKAKDNGNINLYGEYLTQGLADGIVSNADAVASTMNAIRDATISALESAFEMHSPSKLMMAKGINIPAGLADGINAGAGLAYAAMSAMQANLVAQAAATAQMISAAFASNLNLTVKYGTTGTDSQSTLGLMEAIAKYAKRSQAGRGHV